MVKLRCVCDMPANCHPVDRSDLKGMELVQTPCTELGPQDMPHGRFRVSHSSFATVQHRCKINDFLLPFSS